MPARIPMTGKQRAVLLNLPTHEEDVVRHCTLTADDLMAIGRARTPETRLGYALQLCALRYPGRHLRRGELLPAAMLDYIAEQIGENPDLLADFARRAPTRYAQLEGIKHRHGFRDLTHPLRTEIASWLDREAIGVTDGLILLNRTIAHMRIHRIIIPGVSVVDRMVAKAMLGAEAVVIDAIDQQLDGDARKRLDAIISDKTQARQSRLSWLREPASRIGADPFLEIIDKLDRLHSTGVLGVSCAEAHRPRLAQMAREGVRLTAQAFQQMGVARRHAMLVTTLRELEATLTDAAISMFGSLVGRANLRARKRLEETIALSADQGRERLMRIAAVLETVAGTARRGGTIAAALSSVATLDVIEADAALIRRTIRPNRPDALDELVHEYRVFKQIGPRFLSTFLFEGRAPTEPLRDALAVLSELGSDWRKPLPKEVPLGHIERRWRRHVLIDGGIDRTYWELATYFALADALASGDLWVRNSRLHRSLDALLAPEAPVNQAAPSVWLTAHAAGAANWLDTRAAELDAALLEVARSVCREQAVLFTGDKLRFPKEPKPEEASSDPVKVLAARCYGLLPTTRITDVLSQVNRWTGFMRSSQRMLSELR